MSDKVFLDSNILIYCYTNTDFKKQKIARELATGNNINISSQVLNEAINVLHKKYAITWRVIDDLISDFQNNFFIHSLNAASARSACKLAERYKFSFYDSLIISSAIECNCSILYSEDLHNRQVIDNNIQIINPFL